MRGSKCGDGKMMPTSLGGSLSGKGYCDGFRGLWVVWGVGEGVRVSFYSEFGQNWEVGPR